jgi:hypothetical protein
VTVRRPTTGLDGPPARIHADPDPVAEVVIVNVAEVSPAGTVTLAGTDAEASLLWIATEVPPSGAGYRRFTVPVTGVPLATAVDESASPTTEFGRTYSFAVRVLPASVAVMVTSVSVLTGDVKIGNFTHCCGSQLVIGINTDAGTFTAGLLDVRETAVRFTEATSDSQMSPFVVVPPPTVAGPTTRSVTVGKAAGSTTSFAVSDGSPGAAQIRTLFGDVGTVTVVLTVKIPVVSPAGIVTTWGVTVARVVVSEDTEKLTPPTGAGLASVIVPRVAAPPPATEVEASDSVAAVWTTVTKATLLAVPPRPSSSVAVIL